MSTTTPRLRLGRNAYVSGIRARDAGHAIDACPVTPRSRLYRHWRAGWADRDSYLRSIPPPVPANAGKSGIKNQEPKTRVSL
jgi:hypothetical protein